MKWGPVSTLTIDAVHCSAGRVTLKGQDRINRGNKGIWQSLVLHWDTSSIGYVLYLIILEITPKKTGSCYSISFRGIAFSVEN